MKLLATILFLTFFLESKTQVKQVHEFIKTIDSLVSRHQNGGIRYYSEKINLNSIKKVSTALSQDTIHDLYGHKTDSIVLTPKERKLINRQLRSLQKFRWRDNLIENSNVVPSNKLELRVHTDRQAIFDSLSLVDSKMLANYVLKNGVIWGFTFSKPIFFKENNICLFYFKYYYNSSGSENWAFYKKTGTSWKRWIVISAGDW